MSSKKLVKKVCAGAGYSDCTKALLNAAHAPISSFIPTAWSPAPRSDRPDAKRLRRSRVLCTNVIITASGPLLLDAPARRSAPYRYPAHPRNLPRP